MESTVLKIVTSFMLLSTSLIINVYSEEIPFFLQNSDPQTVIAAKEIVNGCSKQAKVPCQNIAVYSTCFGVKMPYDMTSPELVNENFTQLQLQNEMSGWEGLRTSPRCWAVIQPLLCSFYMPKCQNGLIDLPSQERCRIARTSCRIIEEASHELPDFLKCDDESTSPPKCTENEIRVKFNTSGKCVDPMIEVDNDFNHYEGFEGCALKCDDPLYSEEDHQSASNLIKFLGFLILILTAFVIITFRIDWKSARSYPSVTIFWANVGYFIATLGWVMQFLPNAKDDIVCRKDGTIRRNEQAENENVFCWLVASLIYFGLMFSLMWLMVFAYVWNITCNSVGRRMKKQDDNRKAFSVWAIILPIVMTVVCSSFGEIDANSMYGVCFVGFFNSRIRIGMVLLPVTVAVTLILAHLIKGAFFLLNLLSSSSDVISAKGRSEIRSQFIRVMVFSVSTFVLVLAAIVIQGLNIRDQPLLEASLRKFIICKMNLNNVVSECEISTKANPTLVTWNVIIFFCGGLLVSSWAWTAATARTWKRFLKRVFLCKSSKHSNIENPDPPTRKNRRILPKAFSRRQKAPQKRRLNNIHDDPIGLNKLLDPNRMCQNASKEHIEQSEQFSQTNTMDGQETSGEWNAPRRGVPLYSNSVSCASEDYSRYASCDSAMSEMTTGKNGHHSRGRRDWFNKSRRTGKSSWRYPWRRGNRGSCSSVESNPVPQILPAITALIDKRQKMDFQMTAISNNEANRKPLSRESAIQTSIEAICAIPHKDVKPCNLTINLTADKATQFDFAHLREIGTQSKKSFIEKMKSKEKSNKQKSPHHEKEENSQTAEADNLVAKLLIPD